MAEQPNDEDLLNEETTPGYKPPAQKSVSDILNIDQDDESLQAYKAKLLGSDPKDVIVFPEDPRIVIVTKLSMLIEGRDALELDLTGDLTTLKKKPFVIKEGCNYRVQISFYVQREIVSGLKYYMGTHRKGIRVDKSTMMCGSYGPKTEIQTYKTPVDTAPSGMLSRGNYTIKSAFSDDDKTKYLEWEWGIEIKKDWE